MQVVAHERPDLQEQAASLSTQLASYTITLKELEDNLLQRLAASQVGYLTKACHLRLPAQRMEGPTRRPFDKPMRMRVGRSTYCSSSYGHGLYTVNARNGGKLPVSDSNDAAG